MIQTVQDAPTDQPYAEITQTGRWTWDVTITDHFAALLPLPAELRRFTYGSWTVIGKQRPQQSSAATPPPNTGRPTPSASEARHDRHR